MNKVLKVEKSVKDVERSLAGNIRKKLFESQVLSVNFMGSPGAGKTTVIEGVLNYIPKEKVVVIQGDLESDVDKMRLEKLGVDCFQINTHSGCHLSPDAVLKELRKISLKDYDYLFIENVGNLVCPAAIDLGQDLNILINSVAEGSDKPKKYQHIFHYSDALVLTKTDLVGAVDFDEDEFFSDAQRVNSRLKFFKSNKKDEESFEDVAGYIEEKRKLLFADRKN